MRDKKTAMVLVAVLLEALIEVRLLEYRNFLKSFASSRIIVRAKIRSVPCGRKRFVLAYGDNVKTGSHLILLPRPGENLASDTQGRPERSSSEHFFFHFTLKVP